MSKLAILEGKTLPTKQLPYNQIGEEETAAAVRVLQSRNLSGFIGRAGMAHLGGPEVQAFEREFLAAFDVAHAVSFNSASTALQAAVAACGIGPGDEVITTPYTMAASATAILLNNAVPVFADIDEQTYCLDAASVRARITPRTKAILAVNLFGGTPDYSALQAIADEYDLFLIEDNAQAAGATYRGRKTGTFTDIAIFSLNVHKVIQCGEGGVITTNDDTLAHRSRLVRNHGEVIVDDLVDEGGEFEAIAGSNYRLSEVHAAIAREQLKKLDALNALRRERALMLSHLLMGREWIVPFSPSRDAECVYYLFPFRFRSDLVGISRKTFVAAMKAEGFPLGVGYVKPIYLMPMYQQKRMFPRSQFPFVSTEYPSSVSYAKGICPVVERLYGEELLTTAVFHPPNTYDTIVKFANAILRIDEQRDDLVAYEKAHP